MPGVVVTNVDMPGVVMTNVDSAEIIWNRLYYRSEMHFEHK